MRNIFNESKEAWNRTREYITYVRTHPKSEEMSYQKQFCVVIAKSCSNGFFGLLGLILLNGVLGIFTQSIICSLL